MRAGEVLLAHRHDLTNGKNGIAATALGIIDNAWKRDNEQKLRTAFPRENAEISRELVKAALKPSEKQVKSANYGARTASARVAAAP